MYESVSQRWSSVITTRTFGWTTNGSKLVALPSGESTSTGAVTAPCGTVAVICSSESIVNVVAGTVPNRTEFAPVKPTPVIVTEAPTGPFSGELVSRMGCALDNGGVRTT